MADAQARGARRDLAILSRASAAAAIDGGGRGVRSQRREVDGRRGELRADDSVAPELEVRRVGHGLPQLQRRRDVVGRETSVVVRRRGKKTKRSKTC